MTAFWSATVGALLGGLLALLGSYLAIRSERSTTRQMLRVQELQQLATELPVAFHQWARLVAQLHIVPSNAGDDEKQNAELLHRQRVLALRNRLPVEDDEVATEIDRAITGFTGWVSTWVMKPQLTAEDLRLPEEVSMTISAALVLVTANLPGRVREALEEL